MEELGHEIHYFERWATDRAFGARAAAEEFWRGLCPELSITSDPFERPEPPFAFARDTVDAAVACMRRDGYLATGPVLEPDTCERLANAVLRIVDAGYHPLFLSVYDEFWRPFARLGSLLGPVLTAPPRLLGDFWIWCVSPRHAPAGWNLHRDVVVPDTVAADGVPSLLTVWIPYTDATAENGCIRVLPTSRDPVLAARPQPSDPRPSPDLQLLPTRAGAILAWNQHLLHGGGPCAPDAPPRISAGICFQSDARPSYDAPVRFDAPLPFSTRLRHIAAALLRYQKQFRFSRAVLRFVGDHALPLAPLRQQGA